MPALAAEVWKESAVVDSYLSRRRAIPLVREQIGLMLDLLAAEGEFGGRFLDLGCGDGVLGAAVLARFPASRGVLLDFSEPMLAQAEVQLREFGDRVSCVCADYSSSRWLAQVAASAPFAAVVSGYSIHHQPDERKRSLYAELFGTLQPGGWFINVEHVAPAAAVTTRLFDTHFIDQAYAAAQQAGSGRTRAEIAEEFHRRPDKAANILAPVGAQCDWLRETGFVEVDCFFKVHELAVFGGRRPFPSAN